MKTIYKEKSAKKRAPAKGDKFDNYFIEHPEASTLLKNKASKSQYSTLMDIKEGRSNKLREQRILFVSIGLCLSLLFVIGGFEWKIYSDNSTVAIDKNVEKFEDLVEVPQTEQPPPPPPQVEQVQIVEVEDEEIIEDVQFNLDVEMTEETVIEDVEANITEEMPEEEADEIFTIVEEKPNPVGGMQAFYQYVSDNLEYPARATRMNIEGRVFVQFVVEKDGALTDIQVVRGIGAGCDEEAIRVISGAPKWNPGKQRGRPVRVRMILPIVFKLVK